MPEIPIKIRTIGDKQAIQSVKDVNSVVKQMSDLMKKTAFGHMSESQISKANKLIGKFNDENKKNIVLLKQHRDEVDKLKKAYDNLDKLQKSSTSGRAIAKQLEEAKTARNRVQGALNRGTGTAGQLGESAQKSQGNAQAGKRSQLLGGFAEGIGLDNLTSAGIGYLIGKAVVKAFSISSQNAATITDVAGIARNQGATGSFLNAAYGFGPASDYFQTAHLLGFGTDTRQKLLETALSQSQAGVAPTQKSVLDALAMSRLGVGVDTSSALYKAQVAGMPALETSTNAFQRRANPEAGKDLINFRKIMAEAVTTGMTGVRSGEFVEGIQKMVELTQQTADRVNVNPIADVLAAAARMQNTPILQGARGAQTLAAIQSSLLNPGGGVAGQMAALEAGGFGTTTTNVFDARKNLERGLTKGNLGGLFRIFRGKGNEGAAGLSEFTQGKLSYTQAQDILNAGFTTPGGRTLRIEDLIEGTGTDAATKARNTKIQGLMGTLGKDQQGIVEEFRDQLKEVSGIAEVDISKKEMASMLMDPLVAIANATQKLAFGGNYSREFPQEGLEAKNGRLIAKTQSGQSEGQQKVSIQPVQQPAPVPAPPPR